MDNATRPTHNQEIINSYVTGYNKGELDLKIEFIEKACEWLSLNMTDITYFGMNGDLYKPEFIQNFKQAMEGYL